MMSECSIHATALKHPEDILVKCCHFNGQTIDIIVDGPNTYGVWWMPRFPDRFSIRDEQECPLELAEEYFEAWCRELVENT